jgi:hypothetical protein
MLLSSHPSVNRDKPMADKLTHPQWEQLDDQMSQTPSETDPDGVSGEHMQLIALLNKFGFNPISK